MCQPGGLLCSAVVHVNGQDGKCHGSNDLMFPMILVYRC